MFLLVISYKDYVLLLKNFRVFRILIERVCSWPSRYRTCVTVLTDYLTLDGGRIIESLPPSTTSPSAVKPYKSLLLKPLQ
jgi:hypothetical protein